MTRMHADPATLTMRQTPTSQAGNTMAAIKDYILRANLEPGDPLPTESQMCTNLGVSRSSVREAVRTLTALDIVDVRHGHGTFVGRVSMRPMVESLVFRGMLNPGDDYRSLKDVVQVRRALDLALADEVVSAWRSRDLSELMTLVDAMETCRTEGSSFAAEDRAFHHTLLATLDNKLFGQLTDAFWEVHTLAAPRLGAPTPEDIDDTIAAHRAMARAAGDGDATAYREAVTAHFGPLLRVLEGSHARS